MIFAVLRPGFEYLTDGGLEETRGHTDNGEHPDPEYRSGTADDEREYGPGYVPDADTVAHTHAEYAER